MIREMNLAEVRKNFSDVVNEVRYRHDNILLHKSGKPVAALINLELFHKVQELQSRFKHYTHQLEAIYKNTSIEIAESEIQEAVKSLKN